MQRPGALAMISLVAGFRAARWIGIGQRRNESGDTKGALAAFRHALAVLQGRWVRLDGALSRSTASSALWGFARAAAELEAWTDLIEVLTTWRPHYLSWEQGSLDDDEKRYIAWFEKMRERLLRDAPRNSNGH